YEGSQDNPGGLERIRPGFARNSKKLPRGEAGQNREKNGERPVAEIDDGYARGRSDDREDNAPCQLRHGSDFHDFCFFSLQQLIDLVDVVVVKLLQLFLGSLLLILGCLLEFLELITGAGSGVPNANASFFGQFMNYLDQLLATLLVERGKRDADHTGLGLR